MHTSIETVIGLTRFGFSLVFGVTVTALFAGIERTRKNRITIAFVCVVFLFIQTASWRIFGLELTSKLYPLITHLPLILIFSLYYKRPWSISTVSVLSGYLCCQAPRWFGFLAGAVLGSGPADHIIYVAAVFLFYYFLKKYVAGSVQQLMEKSYKSCLLLGEFHFFITPLTMLPLSIPMCFTVEPSGRCSSCPPSCLSSILCLSYFTTTKRKSRQACKGSGIC